MSEPTDPPLTAEDRRLLLTLARRSLAGHLERGERPAVVVESPALLRRRGAFVTIRRRETGALRGCKGMVRPQLSLAEAVAREAINAAIDDPRFAPVTRDELPLLMIEISALTVPRPIRPGAVVLGRHGLLVVAGRRSGLLLPQVPGHHGLDLDGFLAATCRKAGLPPASWRDDPAVALYGFEAEVWGEEPAPPPAEPGRRFRYP